MMYSKNISLSGEDARKFRAYVIKCIRGDFTPEEKLEIERRKARMREINQRIVRNSGGKNPILGY